MADEKSQNPFENLGHYSTEKETYCPVEPDWAANNTEPPQYTASQVPPEASSSTAPATQGNLSGKRPIAIPAIDPANASPFLRAYAPILHNYQLPKDSFLTFLDQLNDVMNTSPPMQVLDATGGVLQSVPILFPIRWIGSAVSGLANLGGQGISKSRSDSVIRQANRELFGPRGLKVEIGKLDALAYIGKIPILDSKGKVNQQAPLLQQLNELSNADADEAQELDLQQRRIRVLQPWIADLEVEVLPWTSRSRLTRFNAALKKRNDPESSRAPRRGEQQDNPERETGFKKGLWLIIQDLDGEK